MSMRRGTLTLEEEWDELNAESIAERIRLIEETITTLEDIPYCHAYGNNLSQTITITASDTPTYLDGFSADYEVGFEFQNSREFKCLVNGYYFVQYDLSLEAASGSSQNIETAIAVNGEWLTTATNHVITGAATTNVILSGNTIVLLRVDDVISIMARNLSSDDNLVLDHINFSIIGLHYR